MNAVDVLIVGVLALSVLFGVWRGFVREVLSLLCWIAAFWMAWAFGDRVALWYRPYLSEASACLVAGYASCFLAVLAAGALLAWSLRKLLEGGGLRGGDRFLGGLFGLARGLLLVTSVVLLAGFTVLPRAATAWRQSALLPAFVDGAGELAQALPPDVTHYLDLGGQSLETLSHVPGSVWRQAGGLVPPATAATAGTPQRASAHEPPRQ